MAFGRAAWVIGGLIIVAGAAGGYYLLSKDGGGPDTVTAFEDGEIARLGEARIDADDVRAQLDLMGPQDRAAALQNPELLSNLIRTMLVQRTVLAEALSEDWEDRAEVKARIARAREVALVESYLQAKSEPPEAYPGEEELKAAYEANKEALRIPEQHRLAQIHIALPKSAGEDERAAAQARLRAVQARLGGGANFSQVAAEQPETAGNGGDIGWLSESQMRPEIRAAVKPLRKGGLSDPIRLDDGWHIIKLVETRPSSVRPFETVREDLAMSLRAERAMALRQEHITGLIGDGEIALNEAGLAALINASR